VVKPSAGGSVRIGFSNPLTGPAAALGANQLTGCQVAIDQLNARGGILGRRLELVSYDSPEPAGAAAIATKLIDVDKVDGLIGHLLSSAALTISQVTNQRGILQIVPGARSDEITGAQCRWNVFRLGSTTAMQATAICPAMLNAYGKSWFFITPDFTFGHASYQACDAALKKLGGRIAGNVLAPLGTADFTPFLAKAQATKPDVLALLLLSTDLVNCLRQASQLGINRQLHVGGGQIDLETVATLPPEARFGTFMLDWYWKQAAPTPGFEGFVASVRKRTGKVPTAHTWFGYTAIQVYALACEAAKTTESKAVARALTNMPLPLDIRMQPNSAFVRGADHQLLSSAFIGDLLAKGDGDPENLVKITSIVAGDKIAPPVAETGCVMRLPA
jgi:branched-chain amino acid transport system substrate-binding protein